MADDNTNKQQREENALLKEATTLLRNVNRLRAEMGQNPLKLSDEEAVKSISSLKNEFKGLSEDIRDSANSASSLYDQLKAVSSEIDSKPKGVRAVTSAFQKMTTEARKLRDDELGLTDLNGRQLESLVSRLKVQKQLAIDAAETLMNEGDRAANYQKLLKNQEKQLQVSKALKKAQDAGNLDEAAYYQKSLNEKKLEQRNLEKEIGEEALAAQKFAEDQDNVADSLIKKGNARIELEKQISEQMGVTGAVVGGVGALMERLGMRSGIFHDAMKEAGDEMRQMAKDTALGAANFSKLEIAAKGFSIIAEGFSAALSDPAAIVGKIVQGFFDVNKASVEFTRLTGQSASALAGVSTEISTTVDLLKTAAELTKATGLNAISVFTPDQIGQISDAKELLGLTGEQAAKLGMQMKLTGKSANEFNQEIYDSVNAFNGSTKSAISQKQALDDVLSASDAITASTGGNTKALGKAAAAARKLGMDLNKVDSIADGLMNFEESIQNELEAQLLTGKNINLNKARELALNNDLGGLAEELAKNGASAAEFSKMNRIQQQALAKSLGMSREELAKSVLTQEAMANMTDDQIAAARGVSLEQSKQMDIQAKIQKSLDKLAQAFAPILDAVVPIVEMLLSVVQPVAAVLGTISKWIGAFLKLKPVMFTLKVTVGAIAAYFATMKIASWAGSAVKGINSLSSSAAQMLENFTSAEKSGNGLWGTIKKLGGSALEKLGGNIAGAFNVGKNGVKEVADKAAEDSSILDTVVDKGKDVLGDKAAEKAEDLVTGGADKTIDAATSAPESITEAVGGATDQTVNAAKGAADVPEAKSSGEKLREFLTNLAAGLREMASMEVVGGALALIPASLGLVAMIPGYLGAKLLENLNGEKLKESLAGLAEGLKEMANGTAVLGALALIPAGLGFAALTLGSIGMAAVATFGSPAATGLQALSTGLSAIGNPMAVLGGLALIPIGLGFAALTVGSIGMAAVALGGAAAAAGLTALSVGLSTMANPMAVLGGLALIPAGLGFAAFTAGAIGMAAIALGGAATAAGLTALGVGLSAFGAAAMNPLTWAGVGLLAALGVALIPLTYALSLLAPLITAFGSVISSVLGGIAGIITAVAAGFTSFLGAISFEKVAALALLGPALMSVAGGLAVLSFSMFSALPAIGMLGALALMAGPLSTLATSLTAIAAGLVAITAALADLETEKIEELKGLISSTALAAPAVAASGAISGMINGITGGGSKESNNDPAMLEKLDAILAAIKAGGDVYMDGNKVGMALTLATTRQ